jgi:hypothetical protein
VDNEWEVCDVVIDKVEWVKDKQEILGRCLIRRSLEVQKLELIVGRGIAWNPDRMLVVLNASFSTQ